MPLPHAGEAIEALLAGVAADGMAVALCDADDVLRYANATFRAGFCPRYDGGPATFAAVIGSAIRDGTGIRLTTTDPDSSVCASQAADGISEAPSASRPTRQTVAGGGSPIRSCRAAGC